MAYYFLNRCLKENLADIERIALELGLEPQESEPPNRSWLGCPVLPGFEGLWWVSYNPGRIYSPLLLQTPSKVSHHQTEVLNILKRFISVCKPTEISDACTIPYKMTEFR